MKSVESDKTLKWLLSYYFNDNNHLFMTGQRFLIHIYELGRSSSNENIKNVLRYKNIMEIDKSNK